MIVLILKISTSKITSVLDTCKSRWILQRGLKPGHLYFIFDLSMERVKNNLIKKYTPVCSILVIHFLN